MYECWERVAPSSFARVGVLSVSEVKSRASTNSPVLPASLVMGALCAGGEVEDAADEVDLRAKAGVYTQEEELEASRGRADAVTQELLRQHDERNAELNMIIANWQDQEQKAHKEKNDVIDRLLAKHKEKTVRRVSVSISKEEALRKCGEETLPDHGVTPGVLADPEMQDLLEHLFWSKDRAMKKECDWVMERLAARSQKRGLEADELRDKILAHEAEMLAKAGNQAVGFAEKWDKWTFNEKRKVPSWRHQKTVHKKKHH